MTERRLNEDICRVKLKGRFVPLHVICMYRGAQLQLRSFLISEMETSGQLGATTALPRGKGLHYTMTKWLGGSQRRAGLFVRTVRHSYQEWNHNFSAHIPVA